MKSGESDPTEIFDLVGNPTRVGILRALAEAYSESPTEPWLEYSDLRKPVTVRDNGNFNYHLGQLDGLVVKGEPGYRLSRIGMRIVSAVSSGVFDPEWTWGPIEAPRSCRFCDDPVRLRYEDGVLHLTCRTVEHSLSLSVPPSLLESHPDEDVIERIAFVEHQWGALTRRGICSECHGYVDGEIENHSVRVQLRIARSNR